MKIRWMRLWIVLILFTGVVVFLIILSRPKPPVELLKNARLSLTQAERMQAPAYAGISLEKAGQYYDSAMHEWNKQNERIYIFRDYDLVESHAVQANKLAREAMKQASLMMSRTRDTIGPGISKLEKQISDFNRRYGNFPFNNTDRSELTRGRLLLNESKIAFKQSNYQEAKTKLESAELIIDKLNERYKGIMEGYFRGHAEWIKWVETTVAASKKDKAHCIIIDKYARECLLYKNGILSQRYNIELGSNWMGDKNQRGDRSTPEGYYRVLSKKSGGETKYHKAFLLNYPNEEDTKRFILNKRNGSVDPNAEIGNLIEIHGHGGKGTDWTDGCIALKDNDMDKLFTACNAGTRVTIVGSIRPLEDLINSAHE